MSYNEWDPLEEVIVGTLAGACDRAYEPALAPYYPDSSSAPRGGRYDVQELAEAQAQLDGFASTLAGLGITVKRPDAFDHAAATVTPDFQVPNGHAAVCPRDVLLVVGTEIIEAPMAQRARFFEYRAYRTLLRDYFADGARWTAAPKPSLGDALYDLDYNSDGRCYHPVSHPLLKEIEPVFDAACFARCGADIFWQPDLVSNQLGADWLQRQLGQDYRIHRIEFADNVPQHIDTTLVPIRPGLILTNPERPCTNGMLTYFEKNGWTVAEPPPSVRTGLPTPSRDVSNWISMNILMLDPYTAVIESAEKPMAAFLEQLDCRVIPVDFDRVYQFGGSFHCCTLDIRRRGTLERYFG